MISIYHTYLFTFSVITVFSSFFILIHIQFLDILPLFHILIHMHSHLMFTLFSSLHLITPMCSRSRLSHYSHSFLFSFFIYIFSSALTLLPLCHIIIHMHSHSMPPRCFHHFISLLISIHMQCHTTVLIISISFLHLHFQQYSYHLSYAFTLSAITLFSSLHFIPHMYSTFSVTHCS